MQDWDRLVMIGIGAGISIYTAMQSRGLWQRRRFLSLTGVLLLILAATGLPILLALYAG